MVPVGEAAINCARAIDKFTEGRLTAMAASAGDSPDRKGHEPGQFSRVDGILNGHGVTDL